MKSLRTIKQLRSDMFKATNKYHQTIIQNLKELGKDLEVVAEGWDEDEGEPKGCKVTSLGEDNESYEAIIDMIRYEASEPVVKVAIHVAWYNYKEINQWWGLSDLTGEAADYVLDSIQWPEDMIDEPEFYVMVVDGVVRYNNPEFQFMLYLLGGEPEGNGDEFDCTKEDFMDAVRNIEVHLDRPDIYDEQDTHQINCTLLALDTTLEKVAGFLNKIRIMADDRDGMIHFKRAEF